MAFSCKGRDICPSCATRRMVETAARMVDEVLPRVQFRQRSRGSPSTARFGAEYNVFVAGGALLGGGNLLSGGSVVTLLLGSPDTIDFWGNHILNGGGLSVEGETGLHIARTVSLESNWWGTRDAAQIEDWIDHAPDDPTRNGLTIDYLPFYGGPVPTEASSVGQLKGKFSGN